MEFPNLGKNCSFSSCNNLDFLPFICSDCNQVFCKDHFNLDKHQCESSKKNIECRQTDNISFVCSTDQCNNYSPVEMLCSKCKKHFCLVHRYHNCFDVVEDLEEKKKLWNEPKEQFDNSLKNINNTINEKIKKASQDPKKQATALKIQLMRLKGKAEGTSSIPITERIYFLILLPKSSKILSKAVFISKEWNVGKVIDSVSTICKIMNKNNDMNSPKLRLFKASNGNQISTDMSSKIVDLINTNNLINGESLIMEYVDPKEDIGSFVLTNFSDYKESF